MQKPDGTYAGSSKEKAELLFKRFPPISPPADTPEIDTSSYPPTVERPRMMKQKIEKAIEGPGQDKIPKRALGAGLSVVLLKRLPLPQIPFWVNRTTQAPLQRREKGSKLHAGASQQSTNQRRCTSDLTRHERTKGDGAKERWKEGRRGGGEG